MSSISTIFGKLRSMFFGRGGAATNAHFHYSHLRRLYREGVSVTEVIEEALRRATDLAHPHVWITLLEKEQILEFARDLTPDRIDELPLYGVPFAIKDNIDLAGVPTTCACPAFTYTPVRSAAVVERLIAAGAIPIGKTNMDQFATGLVGVRSPYGACNSVFDPHYISGGSSSGSAVAVAAGMVTFSLGTDTAGSGRVPAAFNHIVGLKPSKGVLSTNGVFPACRSLDCVSIFAGCSHDARVVFDAAVAGDEDDAYSRELAPRSLPARFRFGIPSKLEFFDDVEARQLFVEACVRLGLEGGEAVEIDFTPFAQAAALLYSGPWVAERRHALGEFFEHQYDAMDQTVRKIIGSSVNHDAVSAFDGAYKLQEFAAAARREWEKMDVLLLPTTGTTYTIAEVRSDPLQLNTNLGYYTNFVNLLDLAAVAVPAGFRPSNELPFGVTLMAPAFTDRALLSLADRLHHALGGRIGVTEGLIEEQPRLPMETNDIHLAVVGAHLAGQPLNHQLTSRGGTLVKTTRTAKNYRLFALANTTPPKPGLVRVKEEVGEGIELEVWALSPAAFGSFVAEVPAPMTIGTATLEDGTHVKSFLCEPGALEGAMEITGFGGWRAFLAKGL